MMIDQDDSWKLFPVPIPSPTVFHALLLSYIQLNLMIALEII
jgi:hypothetical protein